MHMLRLTCTLGVVGLAVAPAYADDVVAPTLRAHAVRRSGPVTIDGHLDESVWDAAPKHSGFTQRFPKDGIKASYETRFAILYDDEAIYVGVWADDPDPAKIRRLLTRRDVDSPADAIAVGIDSYNDKRTAYVFQLNAAGVQRDWLMFDDSNADDTWDAVWTGDVSITDKGWTAEFRIPLNQLRFAGSRESHEWGFQVLRVVSHTQEQATWSPWPRSASEVVSKFGVVDGIDHVKPGRRLELLPYMTGGIQQTPIEAGDPLNKSVSGSGNVGLDLKYGLGPAFTLSATINPDFGQVEADPSQVNLSGNELFFAEKRPFFLEGMDLFRLPIGPGDNPVEGAFYSRRIGAPAPGLPDDYQYMNAPASTRIYTAAKLTGKTHGWSVGALEAVTGEQDAKIIDADGNMHEPIVAPLTNYLVARVKRDLREGKTSIGASATAVNRQLDGTGLEGLLHDQAYTAGAQFEHRWAKNAWALYFHAVGSYVHGSEDAIAETQLSQRHLYQRPDRTNNHFDPTRTSLTGSGMTWKIGQLGDTKHWRFGFGGDIQTLGLELNDMGFQNGSDRMVTFYWGEYHDNEPGDDVLNWNFNSDVFTYSNLEPTLGDIGFECNGHVQLVNYWSLNMGCNATTSHYALTAMRGGPLLRLDNRYNGWININTDNRKALQVSMFVRAGWTPAADELDNGVELGVTVQARSNIDVFLGPSWSYTNDPMQYVEEAADEMGHPHYVFAHIEQKNLGMTTRVNWTFSPKLSLQAYAQPFIATGRYSEYKDVDHPYAEKFRDRFTPIDQHARLNPDGTFQVNQNGMYSFTRPDFSFRQLRSTVVLRWEYRPGSSIFAIWSHGRTSQTDDGRFRLGEDLRGLAGADQENLVMVKANYWIGL